MHVVGCLLVLSLCAAAASPAGAAQLGIKAGINSSSWSDETNSGLDHPESRTGFVGGFFADIPISNHLSFAPELLLSSQGASKSVYIENLNSTIEWTYQFDYLKAPLLVKLTPAITGRARPFIAAGPCIGINTNSEVKIEGWPIAIDGTERFDVTNAKNVIVEFIVDGGVTFDVGRASIVADVRYSYGPGHFLDNGSPPPELQNVEDMEVALVNSDGSPWDNKQSIVSFMIGFAFTL
jgi:hypothetical protein